MMNALRRFAYRGRDFLIKPLLQLQKRPNIHYPDAASQLQLQLAYRALKESDGVLPGLNQAGFKVFSQTDEDGILLYIFAMIGSSAKTCVEICAGDGIECNTANLIINHGWHGLLVDGNKARVEKGREFYKSHSHTHIYPPTFVHSWITRDNVNQVVEANGFSGEIDLLSIDMDGVDYWIWNALDSIDPRVVVVEYQDIIGPEKALTVPYSDTFNAYVYPTTRGMPNFCGASLTAFVQFAANRGYRLVGCNRYGYNAFFIKNPLAQNEMPEIDVHDCFKHPKVLWGMKERFATVKDFPWVEV